MIFLTLSLIKSHVRIDGNDEDTLLTQYANSAEATIARVLNRGTTVAAAVASLTAEYGEVPADIINAGLMLVDHMYQHRGVVSAQSMYSIPYSFDMAVKPYMVLTFPESSTNEEEEEE